MTSVGSFGGATTAGNYTLIYSNVMVGNWVAGFTSEVDRQTPVNVRHNFWATDVLIDPSFPAKTYRHEFTLYSEAGSLGGFISDFYQLSDHMVSSVRTLSINFGDTTTVVVNFGQCAMIETPKLQTPDHLLYFSAGLVLVRFVGKTKPSIVT